MIEQNKLKANIQQGIPVLGTWNTIGSPMFSEILAFSGLDFLIIDFEHGPFVLSELYQYVNSCEGYSCSPIVRIPENKNWMIQQALDQGAHGIIIPGVQTSDEVSDFVKAVKFKPDGNRGFTPFTKAGGFTNINVKTYPQVANDMTLTGIIIESMTAYNNLDSILKIEGLDIVYFGAYDLSLELGSPGDVFGKELIEMISSGIKKTTDAGKCPGGFVPQSVEKIKFIMDLGIKFITYNVDSAILYHGIHDVLEAVRGHSK
mgnify:CR=1 FL=1